MSFGTSVLLSNTPAGTTWALPSAGFVNPSYLGGDINTAGVFQSDGFQIEQGAVVVLSFEGTYSGQTLTHQETLDPTGQTGWFNVVGFALDGSSSGTGVSNSGVAYAFPSLGFRHRIVVSALASGTLVARASLQSDPSVMLGGMTGGGAAGQITTGSLQTVVTAAPTVTSGSAYASGNSVGGLLTFTNAFQSKGSGLLQRVAIDLKSTQTGQIDLVLFNANPTNTTITDKTAFSLAVADFATVLGVVHVTDFTNLGTPSVGQANTLAMAVKAAAGTTLWGALVTRSTQTFTATTDVSVALQIIQD